MSDHTTPCIHTGAVRELQTTQREQGQRLADVSRAQGIALSRLGMDMDGAQVGNGHTVLGRLEAGEDRDEAMAEQLTDIRTAMLTKDDAEALVNTAVDRVVTARGEQKTNRIAAWGPAITGVLSLIGIILVAVLK